MDIKIKRVGSYNNYLKIQISHPLVEPIVINGSSFLLKYRLERAKKKLRKQAEIFSN